MPVAVVGGGVAGLCAYATLRHGGLEPDEIVVYGDNVDPLEGWRRRASAIRQRHMRSESDGHVAATSFPGLAVRAVRRGSFAPLALTLCNRYRPTVDEFVEHAVSVRERSGWDESFVRARVDSVVPVDGGFELVAQSHKLRREPYEHVLLALGHPGLAFPEGVDAVHAYEPHEYADEVTVIGAGMAAATEWLNALAAGARVVSVRRREPVRRPLNLPRQLFTRRGLAAFHRTPPDARVGLLRSYSAPSYPPGRAWDEPLESERFRVAAEVNGSKQVIAATGFKHGYAHDPLLRRLVEEHGLETAGGWLVLAPDSTVPALTDDQRTLAVAGVQAQWAFPAADTIAGAKYAARGFLRRCRTR